MSWARQVLAPQHKEVGFLLVPGLYSRWFNLHHSLIPEELLSLRFPRPAGVRVRPMGRNPNCLLFAGPPGEMAVYLSFLRNRSRLQGGTFIAPHLSPVGEDPTVPSPQDAVPPPAPTTTTIVATTADTNRNGAARDLWAALGLQRPNPPNPDSEAEIGQLE